MGGPRHDPRGPELVPDACHAGPASCARVRSPNRAQCTAQAQTRPSTNIFAMHTAHKLTPTQRRRRRRQQRRQRQRSSSADVAFVASDFDGDSINNNNSTPHINTSTHHNTSTSHRHAPRGQPSPHVCPPRPARSARPARPTRSARTARSARSTCPTQNNGMSAPASCSLPASLRACLDPPRRKSPTPQGYRPGTEPLLLRAIQTEIRTPATAVRHAHCNHYNHYNHYPVKS